MKILLIIILLAIILTIIAFLIVFNKSKNKTNKISENNNEIKSEIIDFEDLMAIVKNSKTSSAKLLETLQKFNENFKIDKNNEQKHFVFLSRTLTHKNVDKKVFQYFHKNLKKNNLTYKKELDVIERKALG